MSSEYQKWEAITKSSPSSGRASVADMLKWLDVGGIQAQPTGGASADALYKERLVERVMSDVLAKLVDFPEPVMPKASEYPSPADATFSPVKVGSLAELTQLSIRAHNGQLESPQSEWRPHIAKNERLSDDERLRKALDAARRNDPLSLVGSPVH